MLECDWLTLVASLYLIDRNRCMVAAFNSYHGEDIIMK